MLFLNEDAEIECLTNAFCNSNIHVVFDKSNTLFNEDTENIMDDKNNIISVHFCCNGIKRTGHGPRCKVMSINGHKETHEIPINDNTGVATFDKKLNTSNPKNGKALAKLMSGFVLYDNNLELLKKYNGYRVNGKLVEGDPSVEGEIERAVDKFNSLSPSERKRIKNNGKVIEV